MSTKGQVNRVIPDAHTETMAYRELSQEGFAAWLERTPRPDNGAWPPARWAVIVEAVRKPVEPPRWLKLDLCQMESRAWLEWKRARSPRFRLPPIEGRRPAIPQALRVAVIERDGHVCGICAGVVALDDVHIDHIFPLVLGGETTLGNLRVTHSICNIRKGARVGQN